MDPRAPSTVYVALLGEGTEAWRPAAGERRVQGLSRLTGPGPRGRIVAVSGGRGRPLPGADVRRRFAGPGRRRARCGLTGGDDEEGRRGAARRRPHSGRLAPAAPSPIADHE